MVYRFDCVYVELNTLIFNIIMNNTEIELKQGIQLYESATQAKLQYKKWLTRTEHHEQNAFRNDMDDNEI